MILGIFVLGVLIEVGLVVYIVMSDGVEIVVDFKNIGDWVVFEGDEVGLIWEDFIGVVVLYSYGS